MSSNSAHMTYQWLGNWGAEKKGKQGEKENVVYFLLEIHVDHDNKTFALQLCNKVYPRRFFYIKSGIMFFY